MITIELFNGPLDGTLLAIPRDTPPPTWHFPTCTLIGTCLLDDHLLPQISELVYKYDPLSPNGRNNYHYAPTN